MFRGRCDLVQLRLIPNPPPIQENGGLLRHSRSNYGRRD
jgi:hypothetical protein